MRASKAPSGKTAAEHKSATPYRNKSARPGHIRSERELTIPSTSKLKKQARQMQEISAKKVAPVLKENSPKKATDPEKAKMMESPALRAARHRKKRTKRVRRTLCLLLVLLVAGAGAFFGIRILQDGLPFGGPAFTYDSAREFTTTTLASKEDLKAESFAQDLCVTKGDVDRIENALLEDGQEGLLFNLSNHRVLYAKGLYDRVYPASITKIMTAMLALKYGNMEDVVTISQENVTLEEGSQVCGFQAGDQVTMDQLLHCLLVYSGNDAASAIATHIGGSTENFVAMMNSYATELGCTGTHFTNPHGLQDENHYTTPYDIYLMLNEARTFTEFTDITQLSSYTVNYTRSDGSAMSTTLAATDHYLTGEATAPKDVTILGGKTGTTDSAGNCLAILTQNAYGRPFVAIVMGASTKELLYQQMNSLLQNIN